MAALKAVPPAAAEASESARLAVGLKRELIDLEQYDYSEERHERRHRLCERRN